MKKQRVLCALCMMTCMLFTACGQEKSENVENAAASSETPVIILGDENLTEEETASPMETTAELTTQESFSEEASTAEISDKTEVDYVQGTYLGIGSAPKDATVVESKSYSDGSYTEILSCEEDTIRIHIEKEITDADSTQDMIQSRMETERGWINTIASTDEVLSESLTYPVYRFQFSTGEGEETMIHDAAYIAAGTEGFLIDCSSEASEFEENLELMEMWIDSVFLGGNE